MTDSSRNNITFVQTIKIMIHDIGISSVGISLTGFFGGGREERIAL